MVTIHDVYMRFPCRKLVRRLLMTACDLCTAAKPWYIHLKSVKKVFEEFYLQVCVYNTCSVDFCLF